LHVDNGTSTASVTANSGGHQIAVPVVFDSATSVAVANAGDTLTFVGPIANAVGLTKTGDGTVEVQGATHLAASSSLSVSAGTLKLAVGSGATVGAGVVANVAAGATLELAGATSALSPLGLGGTDRPAINNAGALSVTGVQSVQVVGAINSGADQAGVTSVAASASLTADHIIQSALVIGGDSDHGGLVTIAPSDDSGEAIDSLMPMSDASAGQGPQWWNESLGLASANNGLNDGFSAGETPLGSGSAVPEPATLALVAFGLFNSAVYCQCGRARRAHGSVRHAPFVPTSLAERS
jgi:hypothetical protein